MPPTDVVRLTAYDPAWPDLAAALLAQLKDQLGDDVVHADHIGSTAIAGMAAKDVLDLQLSVVSLRRASSSFAEPLRALGLVELPAYTFDHVPTGSSSSPAAWEKRFFLRRNHSDRDVNLHVRRVGSPNERLALLFRDWLRAHPDAVPAYAAFKRTLAASVADLEAYTVVKDPVPWLTAPRGTRDSSWCRP